MELFSSDDYSSVVDQQTILDQLAAMEQEYGVSLGESASSQCTGWQTRQGEQKAF